MGVRIQELPETTGINKEDVLIVEDGQGTKKGTVQQLDEALGVSQLKEDKVDKPSISDDGKIPRAKEGNVEWVEVGQPTDVQTNYAITKWLNEHPEATTTVLDGSINEDKFTNALRKKKANYYISVEKMKEDASLIIDTVCVTLGYYEPNDGGGSTYKVREKTATDIDDGGSIHFLNDNLVAELIIGDYVTPEQFGAYGDGKHNDSDVLQTVFDSGAKVVKLFAGHNYKVSKQLNITKSLTLTSNGKMDTIYGLWTPNSNLNFPSIITDNTFIGDNVLYITAPHVFLSHFGVCNIYQTAQNNYIPTYNGIYTFKQTCHAENLAIRGYNYGFITDVCHMSVFHRLYISACVINFFDKYTSDSIFEDLYLNTNSFMKDFITPSIDYGKEKLVGFLSYGGYSLKGGKIEYNYYGVLNKAGIFYIDNIIFDWNEIGVAIFDDNSNTELYTTISNCFFMSVDRHIKSTARKGRLNVNNCRFNKSDGSATVKTEGENLKPASAFTFYPNQNVGDDCCFYNCDLYNCATGSIFGYTPFTNVKLICCNKKEMAVGNVTNLQEINCF